jgi:hypothetical protein
LEIREAVHLRGNGLIIKKTYSMVLTAAVVRNPASGIQQYAFRQDSIDISEKHFASIFRVEESPARNQPDTR